MMMAVWDGADKRLACRDQVESQRESQAISFPPSCDGGWFLRRFRIAAAIVESNRLTL
jgi:hypothetical protein